MKWTYSCPHCHEILNPDETVTLVAEQDDRRFLAGLHPEPGNYHMHLPPDVEMPAGTRWEFSCPVCRKTLTTDQSEDLCALDMHSAGDSHRVYFSRVAGEQATFVVTAEGLLKDYGIHTDRYLEQMVYRKYMR
jgi:uncharacterized protein YbaR (Trm112 family)